MEQEEVERTKLLIEMLKVGQEGKVRPDSGQSNSSGSVCNSTGIVRDAKEASPYLNAIWKKLAVMHGFAQFVVEPSEDITPRKFR